MAILLAAGVLAGWQTGDGMAFTRLLFFGALWIFDMSALLHFQLPCLLIDASAEDRGQLAVLGELVGLKRMPGGLERVVVAGVLVRVEQVANIRQRVDMGVCFIGVEIKEIILDVCDSYNLGAHV